MTDPRTETESSRAVMGPASGEWRDWVRTHGQAQPGHSAEWVRLALIDPVPPRNAWPAWLLDDLYPGQGLTLHRLPPARRGPAECQVITQSGRDLDRIAGPPAAMIGFVLSEAITPRVCVGVSSSALLPQDALQLTLDIHAWFAPGERIPFPVAFDERLVE